MLDHHIDGSDIVISGLRDFSLMQTFDCGQCFRFEPTGKNSVGGVAFGRYVEFIQPSPCSLIIRDTSEAEYERIWKDFLALDEDYEKIKEDVREKFSHGCSVINEAMELGKGIRILRQDKWETVCSFIISQNNNIPRIKKIIKEMSEKYGEPTEVKRADGSIHTEYSFPTAKALYEAGEDALFALKTGFRAKYIYDAAMRVYTGALDLDAVYAMTTEDALSALCEVKGIGMKVASCALLFGFGKTDVFPIDVWMKRIIAKYYPDGIDIPSLGRYAGVGQQYLFYYVRYVNPELK